MSTQYSLSGHESFHCRHYWLKKGFDFVKTNRSFKDEDAVVHLGVGKNMVSSIRYWLKAFGITDENDQLTEIAEYLFDENGWDPFLEDINTIYFLHYLLTTTQKEFTAYLIFEIIRKKKPEFDQKVFKNFADAEMKSEQSENVAKTAFNVITRSYIAKDKGAIDEVHSGFLQELKLIEPSPRDKNKYIIKESSRPDLNPLILLACLIKNSDERIFEFEKLVIDEHAVAKVFALTRDGLYEKLEALTEIKKLKCQIADNAGIKVFEIDAELSFIDVLKMYYER